MVYTVMPYETLIIFHFVGSLIAGYGEWTYFLAGYAISSIQTKISSTIIGVLDKVCEKWDVFLPKNQTLLPL